jgi:hypothetical protein
MSTLSRVVIAAFALSATTASVAYAAYDSGNGVRTACEEHDYTPHGIWDCR